MPEDAEFERIARREASERIGRMVDAMRGHPAEPALDEVYKQAHSLAGFAGELDPRLAATARSLASRLRDERGHALALGPAEMREVERDVERLERAARELGQP